MSWVIDKDEQFVRDVHYVFKGNLSEIGHRKQVLRSSQKFTGNAICYSVRDGSRST